MANDYNGLMFYQDEINYASPANISKETSERIKARNTRIGKAALFTNIYH